MRPYFFVLILLSSLTNLTACMSILGGGDDGDGVNNASNVPRDDPFSESANPPYLSNIKTGEVVGTLSVELPDPSIDTFIVRGTLPVPKGSFPMLDGKTPFALLDVDGKPVTTQVVQVSRYAKVADGAAVIEISARVHRDPTLPTTGSEKKYDIIFSPFDPPAPPAEGLSVTQLLSSQWGLAGSVKTLLADENNLRVVMIDVDQRQYSAAPLRGKAYAKLLENGPISTLVKTFERQEFIAGTGTNASGCAPYLGGLGVGSYLRAVDGEDFLLFDLRLNNGWSNSDKTSLSDNNVGPIYFEQIEIQVPAGWTVVTAFDEAGFDNTSSPNNVRLVDNQPSSLHLFPVKATTHRQLAITPVGNKLRAKSYLQKFGLGFAQPGVNSTTANQYLSWKNPLSANYGPQFWRLPDLTNYAANYRSKHTNTLGSSTQVNSFLWSFATGYSNGPTFEMGTGGLFHPYGTSYGGPTSGIHMDMGPVGADVTVGSRAGYLQYLLQHRAINDRQPMAFFEKDGLPTNFSIWANSDLQIPFGFYGVPLGSDPFGINSYDGCMQNYVSAQGKTPGYQGKLLSYDPYDQQHFKHYTRTPQILAWLGNEPSAKDDLLMAASIAQLSYPLGTHQGWGASLLETLATAQSTPGIGVGWFRDQGWQFDAMATSYALADDAWRKANLSWFEAVAESGYKLQVSCASYFDGGSLTVIHGNPGIDANIDPNIYEAKRGGFEVGVVVGAGLRAVMMSVFEGNDAMRSGWLKDVIRRSIKDYFDNPIAMDTLSGTPAVDNAVFKLNSDGSKTALCSLSQVTPPNNWSKDAGWGHYFMGTPGLVYQTNADPYFLYRLATIWNKNDLQDLRNSLINSQVAPMAESVYNAMVTLVALEDVI